MPSVHSLSAEIVDLSYDLAPKRAQPKMDETHRPFAEVELVCPIPPLSTLDDIVPREQRVLVTQTRDGVDREWDLLLHELSIDHAAAEVTVIARSDEAVLIDEALIDDTPDTSLHTLGPSLRAVVNSVLGRHGWALESGAADADFTVTWNATNLVANPSAEVDASGWIASSSNTVARSTAQAWIGSASLLCTANVASVATIGIFRGATFLPPYVTSIVAGRTYSFSFWARTGLSGKSAEAHIRWGNASAQVGSDSIGTSVSLPTNTWTRATVTGVAPAGATNATVWASATGTFTSGQTVYFDGMCFTEGALTAYFDGSGASPADSHYTYAWTGTTGLSTSTRTRLDSRDPNALTQYPGQTEWDLLAPLVEAAGLRFWCDEQRQWWLTDDDYSVDGSVYISSGYNATQEVEHRAVAGFAFGAVVVEYTWTVAGVQQTAYDVAGTDSPVRLVKRSTPYPGPGAAQAILTRDQGRGRVLDLEAIAEVDATPTQGLTAVLPGLPTQLGTVSSVTWDYPAAVMAVTSRDLLDIPPGAIDLLLGTIDSLAGTIDSL